VKTWDDYKEHVKAVDPAAAQDIREAEETAAVGSAMGEQRNALGSSQRDIPQPAAEGIES